MMNYIMGMWPWWVAGPLIALTMLLLLYTQKELGISSTLRTYCAMAGGDKFSDFFKFDWKAQWWNIVVVIGALLGGYIASHFLSDSSTVLASLSESTKADMAGLGLNDTSQFVPAEIFSWSGLFTLKGFIFIVLGGFFVGFGARWAGGCTSGHAISGLSNLQLPSLIAVIGFFIGGLITTFLFIPLIMKL